MCYSAQIWADYRKYTRLFGAEMGIREYIDVYWRRTIDGKVKIPKGMEAPFLEPVSDTELEVKKLIDQYNAAQTMELEQEVFRQRKRLADAERVLETKTTKAATESKRIAIDKVEKALSRLDDLRRKEPRRRDARIFPGVYAPVMVMEGDRLVVKPMRYQCRPAGKPAFYDTKYPGTYNARRDNLSGFWGDLFGFSHGVMVVDAFYENVARHRVEGRELMPGEKAENTVLEFRPSTGQDMLVACLWSHWRGKPGEPELLSFAAITDDPPPEVAAAGHDRCIVPLRPEHVEAWLHPQASTVEALNAILDDRDRPYYEHRLAA
jgi:putative SOS response-associated peptidase YedK